MIKVTYRCHHDTQSIVTMTKQWGGRVWKYHKWWGYMISDWKVRVYSITGSVLSKRESLIKKLVKSTQGSTILLSQKFSFPLKSNMHLAVKVSLSQEAQKVLWNNSLSYHEGTHTHIKKLSLDKKASAGSAKICKYGLKPIRLSHWFIKYKL